MLTHDHQIKHWREMLDNYEVDETKSKRFNQLLNSDAQSALFEGCSEAPKTEARDRFLSYLYGSVQNDATIMDPPNEKTIKLEDLLVTSTGMKLYKEAIEEELNSKAFRKAVYLDATKHIPGQKWDKRAYIWVGGPSASGKTYGANNVIKMVDKSLMKPNQSDQNSGNDVTFIDGSMFRERSQISQLVLQTALAQGYKGIDDLHENTKISAKSQMYRAAILSDTSIIHPSTFTTSLHSDKMKMIELDDSFVQVFSEVVPPKGNFSRFQRAVYYSGNDRAWNKRHYSRKDIKINITDIGCESKVYEPQYFLIGRIATSKAKSNYKQLVKNPISINITNDLIFLRKNSKGKWVECFGNDKPDIKMSTRDYKNYKNYRSGKMHIKGASTQQKNLISELNKQKNMDLETWYEYCLKNDLLHPPLLKMKTEKGLIFTEENFNNQKKQAKLWLHKKLMNVLSPTLELTSTSVNLYGFANPHQKLATRIRKVLNLSTRFGKQQDLLTHPENPPTTTPLHTNRQSKPPEAEPLSSRKYSQPEKHLESIVDALDDKKLNTEVLESNIFISSPQNQEDIVKINKSESSLDFMPLTKNYDVLKNCIETYNQILEKDEELEFDITVHTEQQAVDMIRQIIASNLTINNIALVEINHQKLKSEEIQELFNQAQLSVNVSTKMSRGG